MDAEAEAALVVRAVCATKLLSLTFEDNARCARNRAPAGALLTPALLRSPRGRRGSGARTLI